MPSQQTILIAHNPTAGASDRSDLLAALQARLGHLGYRVCPMTDLLQLETVAHQLHADGMLKLVIAAGGDGTVAAVATRVPSPTCLAVFPLGTENLLAKSLGVSADIEGLAQSIQAFRTTQLDALSANGRLALITIGVGFDADVVRQVHLNRRGHITKWNYAWPIFRSFLSYSFPMVKVQIQGEPISGGAAREESGHADARTTQERMPTPAPTITAQVPAPSDTLFTCHVPWVFIANVARYAGGLSLLPNADPKDGWLDVGTFSRPGRLRGLYYALQIALGRHVNSPDFQRFRAKRIWITSESPVGYQIDGDYGGSVPLEVEVLPNRLRLLCPLENNS